jgi:hypothetical protein
MIALPIPNSIEAVYEGIPATVGERRQADVA